MNDAKVLFQAYGTITGSEDFALWSMEWQKTCACGEGNMTIEYKSPEQNYTLQFAEFAAKDVRTAYKMVMQYLRLRKSGAGVSEAWSVVLDGQSDILVNYAKLRNVNSFYRMETKNMAMDTTPDKWLRAMDNLGFSWQ